MSLEYQISKLRNIDERILCFTSLCGRAVCQISDSINLVGGSIEISDFGADVNSRAPLKYSVFTRQVQLGRSTNREAIQQQGLKDLQNNRLIQSQFR